MLCENKLLVATNDQLIGYDAPTGKELWRVRYPDFSSAPRPLYDHGLAYFVTGMSKTEFWAVRRLLLPTKAAAAGS